MTTSGVRLARTSDAEGVGRVNEQAWRVHYSQILPASVLDAMSADDLAMTWAGAVLNPPTNLHRLLVCSEGDQVLGYAAVGPVDDSDTDAELLALEVLPAHTRQGHGSRLMAAAIELAQSSGFTSMATWCPLADEPRREFLQSAGWGPDGAYRDLLVGERSDGSDLVLRQVRLTTDISP